MRLLSRYSLLAPLLLVGLLNCNSGGGGTPPAPNPPPPPVTSTTFTNPLLPSGPDPWVYQKDGFYYYLATTGGDITIRKTARMSELGSAVSTTVWTPPPAGLNSRDVWAPELHFLDGKWYVYFTAGPGNCCGGQRTWVLENAAADPTTGPWTLKGQLVVPGQDLWAIDATILEQNGKRYVLWSGQEAGSVQQNLYIAQLSNPWTITGPRALLSQPTLSWEINGSQSNLPKVNEGPEILKNAGKTFLIYSASHCATDDYCLGQLTASATADPMDPAAWTKTPTPVFTRNDANRAFGPGHNSFFVSKDGLENWLVYHANPQPGQQCGNARSPRMQKFTFRADGSPDFGSPVATSTAILKPGGE